jgi:hypothetical protein
LVLCMVLLLRIIAFSSEVVAVRVKKTRPMKN